MLRNIMSCTIILSSCMKKYLCFKTLQSLERGQMAIFYIHSSLNTTHNTTQKTVPSIQKMRHFSIRFTKTQVSAVRLDVFNFLPALNFRRGLLLLPDFGRLYFNDIA